MTLQDIKIFILNSTTFLVSMTNIDAILKIALLLVSIGYTIQKWYIINNKK